MRLRLVVARLNKADYCLGLSQISYSFTDAYNSMSSMLEATLMYMSFGLKFLRLSSSPKSSSES